MGCLFGYFGKPDPRLLPRMADRLSHRSPGGWDRVAMAAGKGRTCEIGHGSGAWSVRAQLAQDPEPPTDAQAILGYSGVFFRPDDATDPRKTDPSRLLTELRRTPDDTLTGMAGAFTAALATADGLRLARDPAGIKVLYWTVHPERLVFASEIKALFADPNVARRLRVGALAEYLTFSYIPGERTMFEEIHELQPGTLLHYQDGTIQLRRHFRVEDFETEDAPGASDADAVSSVRECLERSVAECCRCSTGPPAVFLSGGIDSSAVLAMAARRYDQPLNTFSVHFGKNYANENEFVSMMTDRYQTRHTWLEIKPKGFLRDLREIIWRLDDPIGDPITVPNFLLSRAASEAGAVVLNGEGGDPCFGGPKNIPMMLARIYGRLPDDPAEGWMERAYLVSYRKCFSDLAQLLTPDVFTASGGEAALIELLRPFFNSPRPARFINKLMAANIRLKGANLILVKVDKMSAANGLLALPPLFSRRIMATSMACPPRLKLAGSVEKAVLKRAVADLVPQPIIDRPKSGMMVPVRFWLQKDMKRYAKKLLSKRNLKRLGYFNPGYVKKIMDYNKLEVAGNRHGLKLWMLVTFLLWHEQMVEGKR